MVDDILCFYGLNSNYLHEKPTDFTVYRIRSDINAEDMVALSTDELIIYSRRFYRYCNDPNCNNPNCNDSAFTSWVVYRTVHE